MGCTENQKLADGEGPDVQPHEAYDAEHGMYQQQKPQTKQAPSQLDPSPFNIGQE